MKKLLIYLVPFLILFGASSAFAVDYREDFEDGTIDEEIWWIEGDYEITDGALHMFDGDNTWVRLRPLNELIYYFKADVKVSSSNDQIVGITSGWWQLTDSSWILYQIHLKYLSIADVYQASFGRETPEGGTELGRASLGSGSVDEWHTLSITINEDSITFGIDGNETNLFNGLFAKPDSVWRGDASVHGHDSIINPDYFADNLVAYSRLNPAKFDYVLLGSEVRQYDPSRYTFDENSIWYNGNPYWYMISFAGTSGEPPVYPVYLDAPIYSDPSNTEPLRLNDKPNYVTNTNFSDFGLLPIRGFEIPGSAWENKTYTFFIDANGNGLFDSGETNEDWFIPSGSIREMDVINNVNISGGIHPTISWDPVPDADVYMVNFYSILESGFPNQDVRLHTSGHITGTSYTYNGDLFSDGKEYAIWVQAREFHPIYGGLFINRSGYFTKYKNSSFSCIPVDGKVGYKNIWQDINEEHQECAIQDGDWDPIDVASSKAGEKITLECTGGSFLVHYYSVEGGKYKIGECPFERGSNETLYSFAYSDNPSEPDCFLATRHISRDYGIWNDKYFNPWTHQYDYDEKYLDWAVIYFLINNKTHSIEDWKYEYNFPYYILFDCTQKGNDVPDGCVFDSLQARWGILNNPLIAPEDSFVSKTTDNSYGNTSWIIDEGKTAGAFMTKTIGDTYYDSHLVDDIDDSFMKYFNYLMCDFNGDGVCNDEDYILFQNSLGSCSNDDRYNNNMRADVDGSGCIDAKDEHALFISDIDKDSIPDSTDNCTADYNPDQVDSDKDGRGDACDTMQQVPLDIKPQSCPNPLNTRSKGVLPLAILGTNSFDVTKVDPSSVKLMGVTPLKYSQEDVATPFEPFMLKEDAFDCNSAEPDGYLDYTFKFNTQEIVSALGSVTDGGVKVLQLTGNLLEEYGGMPIIGEDVVIILQKQKK